MKRPLYTILYETGLHKSFYNDKELIMHCERYAIEYQDFLDGDFVEGKEARARIFKDRRKLGYKLIPEDDERFYEADLQLIITTNDYDWRHTVAYKIKTMIDEYIDNDVEMEGIEELVIKYNAYVKDWNIYWDGELELIDDTLDSDYLEEAVAVIKRNHRVLMSTKIEEEKEWGAGLTK